MGREFLFLQALLCVLPALASEPLTFYRNIASITNNYCVSCHRPGEAGPFPLLTYADVKKRAPQIIAVTKRRYMPPWLPDQSVHFANERRLTDEQIHTIEQWVNEGAPEGSLADAPPAPKWTEGWQLGPPDLIVESAQAYRLQSAGPDTFWNFVLRSPVDRTRFIKAIEIRPGNKRVVHHANLLIDRTRESRTRESFPGAGFPGMDLEIEADTFEPDSHFLFWKPGSTPTIEPEGMAWRLDPANDLVLNVHLQSTGKAESVQPSIGLYFTDLPQTRFPMLLQLEHDGAIDIPAGENHFVLSDSLRLPLDVDVLSIYPHAHYLGKLIEGYAVLPDGSRRPLIRIRDWDLNWQGVYRYTQPVFLPKRSVVHMRWEYDNSAANSRNPHHPPARVRGGNQSTDEMGHLWLQVLPRGTEDHRDVLQEAVLRHRLEKYPADFSAHFNLGALFLSRKQPDLAIPYFRDALRVEGDNATALNALGAALAATGKEPEAIESWTHTLQANPHYSNARYNLANALAKEGRNEEAAQQFHQVLQDSPNDAAARDHLFQILTDLAGSRFQAGNLGKATDALREAAALEPANADVRSNLGVLLARQGDRTGAITEWEAALKLDPSNQTAQRNLDIARRQTR